MFPFTPYYDPSPPWCPIVFPPYGILLIIQKGCIPIALGCLLSSLIYPQWYTMLPRVHLMQVPRVYLVLSPYLKY